jgi:hypothetical protein
VFHTKSHILIFFQISAAAKMKYYAEKDLLSVGPLHVIGQLQARGVEIFLAQEASELGVGLFPELFRNLYIVSKIPTRFPSLSVALQSI